MGKKSETNRLRTAMDNIKNRFHDILGEACSNCEYMREEPSGYSKFFASVNYEPLIMVKKCSVDNTPIEESEVNKRNCSYFKRKGQAPAKRKIQNFISWTKRQWKEHDKIIVLTLGSILTIVAIVVSYLLQKGLI